MNEKRLYYILFGYLIIIKVIIFTSNDNVLTK